MPSARAGTRYADSTEVYHEKAPRLEPPTSAELAVYDGAFTYYEQGGFINGAAAKKAFTLSKLRSATLAAVWAQSDLDRDARLNRVEFRLALHLVVHVLRAGEQFDSREKPLLPRVPRSLVDTLREEEAMPGTPPVEDPFAAALAFSAAAASAAATRGVSTVGVEDPFAATAPAAAPAPEASFAARAKREGSFRKDPFKERDAAEPSASLQALHDQRSSMLAMLARATEYDDDDDDDDEGEEGDDEGGGGSALAKLLRKQGSKARRLREEEEALLEEAERKPRKSQKAWDEPEADFYDDVDFTEEEVRVMRERKKSKPKKKWQAGGEDDSWVPGDD